MRVEKELLLFLLSLVIYVLYASDYDNKINELREKIKYISMKVSKEEYLLKNKDDILLKIEDALKVLKKNEEFLFKNEKVSEIQNKIQDHLKKSALTSGAKFLGASWDEPLIYENYKYKEIPITSSVKGIPPSTAKFFYQIYIYDKLLRFKSLEIGRSRPNRLLFSFKISGYKMILEKENKEAGKNKK